MIAASEPLRLPDVPPSEQIAALAELERQATRSGAGGTEIERLTRQLAGFRRNYDARENLMRELKAAGNVVLSAHPDQFRGTQTSLTDVTAPAMSVNRQAVEADVVGMAPAGDNILMPPAAICDASRAVGVGGFAAGDADGTPGAPLLVNIGGTLLPSLPLAITAALTGGNGDIVVAAGDALTVDGRVYRTGPGFAVLPRRYSNADGSPGFHRRNRCRTVAERRGRRQAERQHRARRPRRRRRYRHPTPSAIVAGKRDGALRTSCRTTTC